MSLCRLSKVKQSVTAGSVPSEREPSSVGRVYDTTAKLYVILDFGNLLSEFFEIKFF